jgi:peptide/nickel transport system ATP-binding protein
MALARQPDLLVLDEPTTGLDVTTQAHVLALLDSYRREHGMTMLYVSHDLGVIAHMSERVAVMYAGELVEMASAAALFGTPHHPYTRGLLASIPRRSLDRLPQALPGQPPTPPVPSRPACAFAPRCAFADAQCDLVAPPLVTLPTAPDHAVRCHHWAQVIATETRSSASPAPPRKASNGTTPSSPLLRLDDIAISYGRTGSVLSRWQRAAPPDTVGNMSLGVQRGETLALVGESGSGKTTIVRAVAGLKQPHVGRITFGDADITSPVDRRPAGVRRAIQLIFQNPDASLNPRQTIAEILAQPLRLYFGLNRTDCARRAQMLLDQVRLSPSYLYRFPNQLSGGEKQRVAIARAFAADPALVLCDEITSALDVSVQAAVLEVLAELQAQQGVTYLFITHDLAVVRAIAERVAVLYHGRLCEVGSVAQVYAPQWHPYTAMLLDAVLEPVPPTQSADVPAPISDPAPPAQGCPFQRRCPHHIGPICDEEPPPWQQGSSGHTIRCHIPLAELVGNYSRRCKNLYDR